MNICYLLEEMHTFLCNKCKGYPVNLYEMEANGIQKLYDIVGKQYFQRTNEACKADLLFQPDEIKENLWLPIQIKTSNYSNFCINKNNYTNMLVICIDLPNNKFYLLNGNVCSFKQGIKMRGNSKYNKYLIENNQISDKLIECYYHEDYITVTKEEGMTPLSKTQLVEFKYQKIREHNLPFINFDYPDIQNSVVDYNIGKFRIQEKTANWRSDCENVLSVSIHRGKGQKYNKDNFDYLWVNLPNSYEVTHFYLIPTFELIDSKDENKIRIYLRLKPEDDSFYYNKYLHKYNEIECVGDLFEY